MKSKKGIIGQMGGSKRPKRIKTRKSCRRNLGHECDKLLHEIIMQRDKHKCRYCSRPGNQGHHIFSRRYLNTRWDSRNIITLCYPHHMLFAHSKVEEFRDWIIQQIGQNEFERLKLRANMKAKIDLVAIKLALEKEKADIDK